MTSSFNQPTGKNLTIHILNYIEYVLTLCEQFSFYDFVFAFLRAVSYMHNNDDS